MPLYSRVSSGCFNLNSSSYRLFWPITFLKLSLQFTLVIYCKKCWQSGAALQSVFLRYHFLLGANKISLIFIHPLHPLLWIELQMHQITIKCAWRRRTYGENIPFWNWWCRVTDLEFLLFLLVPSSFTHLDSRYHFSFLELMKNHFNDHTYC